MNKLKVPHLRNCNIAVIGLGYVGLPLALEIGKKNSCLLTKKRVFRNILGFDINEKRIDELNEGFDINKIFSTKQLKTKNNLIYSSNKKLLSNYDIFIIAVPTPIDAANEPDLFFLKEASKLVGKSIKNRGLNQSNPIVIFESTVYPGVTEDICVPLIEKKSGKKYNSKSYRNSFYAGYSPERINPGDSKNTISSIIKVTSGCNKLIGSWVNDFYGSFISAGTFKVSSIKIAEAAKVIENTQRDINIALVNELAILFEKLEINTKEVLNAANTKWNFHRYSPGLVGGHCIGVDPYYLTFKAKQIGYSTNLISAGRNINDYMHKYLIEKILFKTNLRKKVFKIEEVLLLGISYKSNCGDIRNSQLICLVENMKKEKMNITIYDPQVNKNEVYSKTGLIPLDELPNNKKYSLIIFALNHKEFKNIKNKNLQKLSYDETLIFDLTNRFSGRNIFNL